MTVDKSTYERPRAAYRYLRWLQMYLY